MPEIKRIVIKILMMALPAIFAGRAVTEEARSIRDVPSSSAAIKESRFFIHPEGGPAREVAGPGSAASANGISVEKSERTPGAAPAGHDPLWPAMWGPARIGVEAAWEITRGASNTIIAIIDTGCDMDHPDLIGALWTNAIEADGQPGIDDDGNGYVDDLHGWDFVSAPAGEVPDGEDAFPPDPFPDDASGHGTHVAGIIAAVSGNGIGIEGIAPGCRLMILRAACRDVGGIETLRESDVIEAVRYAVSNGASVINMSFGGGESDGLHDALIEAADAGVVLVASAGNDNGGAPAFPGAWEETIAVGAMDPEGRPAVFSAAGEWIDCCAPGVSIVSTEPQGYGTRSGTSVAAPFVSAGAALLKSREPSLSGRMIMAQLINTCEPIAQDVPAWQPYTGSGLTRPDLALAVEPGYEIAVTDAKVTENIADGGGTAGPGESLTLRLSLENRWSALEGCVLRLESQEEGVSIPDGQTVEIVRLETFGKMEADFSIICGGGAPRGELAKFGLVLTTGPFTRKFPFTAMVCRDGPLCTGAVFVEEISGDGNGGADPGERVLLRIELTNETSRAESVTGFMDTEPGCPAYAKSECGPVEVPAFSAAFIHFELEISADATAGGMVMLPLRLSGPGVNMAAGIPLWISYTGRQWGGAAALTCQAEPGHSGYFDRTPERPLGLKWESILPGEGSLVCQPVAAEGKVFVSRKEPAGGEADGGAANFLYALEDAGGDIVYRKRLPGESFAGPSSVAWHGGVVFASCGGYVHAVDAASAQIVWSWSPGPGGAANEWRAGEPTICEGRVICEFHAASGPGEDLACALDPFTGKELWREGNGDGMAEISPPACLGGRVFSVDGSGTLAARKVETGETDWSADTGIAAAAPVIAWRGMVLATGSLGTICAFDAETGEEAWRFETEGIPAGPACVDPSSGEMIAIVRTGRFSRIVAVRLDGGTAGGTSPIDGTGFSGLVSARTGAQSRDSGGASITMFGGSAGGRFDIFECGPAGFVQTAIYSAGDVSVLSPSFHDGEAIFVSVNTNGDDRVAAFGTPGTPKPAGAPVFTGILPNPFNPSARIRFDLPSPCRVSIAVYDVSGRLVRRLIDGALEAGPHQTEWDGRNDRGEPAGAGVYLCRLRAGNLRDSRKLILLR